MENLNQNIFNIGDLNELEKISDLKYELIDNHIIAMGSAKADHGILATSIASILNTIFKNTKCTVIIESLRIKVDNDIFRPDVTVVCSKLDLEKDYTEKPDFIVEVLSKSTAFVDRTKKLFSYLKIPNLKGYLIIEKETHCIELYKMTDEGIKQSVYVKGDILTIDDFLEIKIDDIYFDLQKQKELNDED